MKQELRCHAVLCPKEDKAKQIAGHLQDRLHQALVDFKKEKISRQNARLSLANSIHENPSMPYRKLLLQTGTCNYKPPIERSKSAPKLTSIEEADMEEEFSASDDDDDECVLNTNYNIAMLQVHRNPTILLDDCSWPRAERATPPCSGTARRGRPGRRSSGSRRRETTPTRTRTRSRTTSAAWRSTRLAAVIVPPARSDQRQCVFAHTDILSILSLC